LKIQDLEERDTAKSCARTSAGSFCRESSYPN